MRLHRFYVSQPLGEEVVIEEVSLIKQWLKVFRYSKDDCVILFNGDGHDYTYELLATSHSSCVLTLKEKRSTPLPSRKCYLFLSLIKKDLFELAVEKAVELGVTDIVPIVSARTEKKQLNTERITTIIREATEQSGRSELLTLHSVCDFTEALTMLPDFSVHKKHTHPATLSGVSFYEIMGDRNITQSNACAFFVGPEGGWSAEEEELFKKQEFTCISLSETVLRSETAAITCALLSKIL